MSETIFEEYPKSEWQRLESFANRIASFPLFRDNYTVDSYRFVSYSEEDVYQVANALIHTWEEIGIKNAKELIQDAFHSIFSSSDPKRFAQAIEKYEPLWREQVPYMILSAGEFLVRAKDPLEMKRFMGGGFSHDVWYYYLHILDRRYTDQYIIDEISRPMKESSAFDINEEIQRQLASQPEVDPEVLKAREFVDGGVYPSSDDMKDLKFVMEYQKALESKTRQVIGSTSIDFLMRRQSLSFEEAFGSVFEDASLIARAGQNLLKLNRSMSHFFN